MSRWTSRLVLAVAFIAPLTARAQAPAGSGISLTTRDRIGSNAGWWPTKGDAARSLYAGADACKTCHRAITATQQTTPMFHAATLATESEILKKHEQLTFQEPGFNYSLVHTPQGATFSVSDGANNQSQPAIWALGTGEVGQTYVLEKSGAFTETRLSYFTSIDALDITPGQKAKPPDGLEKALGHGMDSGVTRLCFGCHTTASSTSGVFDLDKATPGVTCAACHGPGARHVAAMKIQQFEKGLALIMNPQRLSPADSVDFCGACHRTWADVAMDMPSNLGLTTLRFQPYRLEQSRCWGKNGDVRITCIACHDPHQPLVRELTAYDSKCIACHSGKAIHTAAKTVCKVATRNCVSCHMPRVEVPQTHATFTDHDIRIVASPAAP